MKLALDIDSTIFPLLDSMEECLGGRRVRYEDCHTWGHLAHLCGGVDNMFRLFDQAMAFSHARRFSAFPHAIETVNQLVDHGVEVHVMTRRPEKFQACTTQWLTHHGLKYHSLDVDLELDKVKLCHERDIKVLVDDDPATIEHAHRHKLLAYSLAFPYNMETIKRLNIPVTRCWGELGAILQRRFQL